MTKFLFLVLLFPFFAFAQSDIVPSISITGLAKKMPTGEYYIPVRVSVRNAGNDIAGRFKINLEWSHASFSGTKLATLKTVVSPDSSFRADGAFYVWTNRAMFVGNSFAFSANVVIPKTIPAKTKVYLRVLADSCYGEEFMPYFCRIDETHEDNNYTILVNTTLPL